MLDYFQVQIPQEATWFEVVFTASTSLNDARVSMVALGIYKSSFREIPKVLG
jgi:hypothetical protein